jgi:hypothetical protein
MLVLLRCDEDFKNWSKNDAKNPENEFLTIMTLEDRYPGAVCFFAPFDDFRFISAADEFQNFSMPRL